MKINLQKSYLLRKIITNTIIGWLAKLLIAVSGFVLTPVLLSGLGRYEYGIWVILGQAISFLLIADLGVANSVGRLVSKYDALNLTEKKNAIYSSSLLIFIGLMAFLILATPLLAAYLPKFLKIHDEEFRSVYVVFCIMILNVALTFPLRIGRGLLQAVNRYDYIDIAVSSLKIIQLAIILTAFYIGELSLLVLSLIMAVSNVLAELVIFLRSKITHDDLGFSLTSVSVSSIKELLSLGGASLAKSLSAFISNQGMIFLVGSTLGVIFVPLYSIPVFLLIIIGSLVGRVGSTFMPIASAFKSLSEVEKIVDLSIYGFRYMFAFGLIVFSAIFLYSDLVLSLWLPSNEISDSDLKTISQVLLILALPVILSRCNQCNKVILISTGYHWITAKILLVFSILGLLVGLAIVKYTSLGIYGIAIGWIIKLFFGDLLLIFLLTTKYYHLNLQYYRRIMFEPIIFFLPFIVSSFVVKFLITLGSFFHFMAGLILFLLSALFFLYLVVERKHLDYFSFTKLSFLKKAG